MSTTKRRNTMFRISFGQRLVMIIAYVLLPVVSQPLTALPKTAPLRPSATAPPQPREAPPPPSDAPPQPTPTAPPQSTDSPQASTKSPLPPSETPPQPSANP